MRKKYFILIYLFFNFLFVMTQNKNTGLSKNNESKKTDFTIQRNNLKGKATIYLKINELVTDSVTIGDLDFIIDSLVQLNDTLWKYMYSFGYDESHGMSFSRQVLIQVFKNKIHFSYISDYRYFNQTSVSEDFPFDYLDKEEYVLNLNDSIPNIQMWHYRKVKDYKYYEHEMDSSTAIVYLNYDNEKKVFYSSIDILNGEFGFLPKESEKRKYEIDTMKVYLNNEKVMTLKIEKSHYIYYKHKWFILQTFGKYRRRLISFLPMEESSLK